MISIVNDDPYVIIQTLGALANFIVCTLIGITIIRRDSKFLLNQFLISINKNKVFNLKGYINDFNTHPELYFSMQENSINLNDFENIIKLFINASVPVL